MNVKIILTTSRYLIIAVALQLLHTSLAQTSVLQVTYNFNDSMPELVSLECLDHNVTQAGATYTFMDPQWREENRSVDAEGRSYEFTNYPTNESLITCTIGNVESEPVKVVAVPQYTAGVRFINRYVYSDSAVADVVCPFEMGRLREPVKISWNTADSKGNRVGSITNATNGVYWLEEENNRILHVNISTPGPLRYQCAGEVEICRYRTSCMQSPPSYSPTFVVLPTIDRLSVTEPVSVTMDQYYESVTFNCTATGSGDFIIEWTCSDGSNVNCGMSSISSSNNGSVTSTLVITSATSNLTVTCNVMQNLTSLTSGESASIEVRLPPIEKAQKTAQFFMPVPTTVTVTASSSDLPTDVSPSVDTGSISHQDTAIYIITFVLLFAIITVIVCCYHYRKKTSLGQRLRRMLLKGPGDPASHIYDVPTEIYDTQLIANDRELTIAHPNHETRMFMQENSAYGTDIAIAPEIATERNIAYGHNSRSDTSEIGIGHPVNEYGLESRTDDTTSTTPYSAIFPCPITMNLPGTRVETSV